VKTQIIQLETHDDTISVKDKMDWSQTSRVLLVWPRGVRVHLNRLDLVLLDRYCSANGSQLALLTRDRQVVDHASEVGIPVFQSRHFAQSQAWGKSNREFARRDLIEKTGKPRATDLERSILPPTRVDLPPWARIGIFSTAVLAVLAIGGLLLPSASIAVPAEKTSRSIQIPIKADPDEAEVSLSGLIPAREVTMVLEGQANLPATGTLAVPSQYASGEVVFTNLSDQSILIPQHTFLSTESDYKTLYVTMISGTTPEGIGKQVTVPVQALEPGTKGNISENQLTSIQQELGADLAVTNPLPITGGTDLMVPAPSEADRDKLLSTLEASLLATAQEGIVLQLAEDDIPLPPCPAIDEVISKEFDPAEGQPGETLTLDLQIRFNIEYAAAADLLTLASGVVLSRYQDSQASPLIDTISLTTLADPLKEPSGVWTWDMEVDWQDKKNFTDEEIIQLVLGKKPTEAALLLQESLDLSHIPVVTMVPSWWWRIPALPFRIHIVQEGE
jgi:hypothetical protein